MSRSPNLLTKEDLDNLMSVGKPVNLTYQLTYSHQSGTLNKCIADAYFNGEVADYVGNWQLVIEAMQRFAKNNKWTLTITMAETYDLDLDAFLKKSIMQPLVSFGAKKDDDVDAAVAGGKTYESVSFNALIDDDHLQHIEYTGKSKSYGHSACWAALALYDAITKWTLNKML